MLFFVVISSFNQANAAKVFNEKYYQNEWCSRWHGKTEVVLKDRTRIDCETKNYVVEFDFARKWAEAFGQSFHYAQMTGKKPAIILIIEKPSDFKYLSRLKPMCKKAGITLWYIKSPLYNYNSVKLISSMLK